MSFNLLYLVNRKTTIMINLRISLQKIVLHLFFLFAIFFSFTNEDLETVSLNIIENNPSIEVTTENILNEDALLQDNFTENNLLDENNIVIY